MNYQDLKDILNTMSEADLKKEVVVLSVYDGGFVRDVTFHYADASSQFEYGTPYLLI